MMWPNLLRRLAVSALLVAAALTHAASRQSQQVGERLRNIQEESQQKPEQTDQVQEQAPKPPVQPAPKPQFFAGTVTDLDHEHITVSRSLVGKPTESRRFLIKPGTKVSKSLRPKARVTVRYQHLPEGDVALEIQIHSQPPAPRAS